MTYTEKLNKQKLTHRRPFGFQFSYNHLDEMVKGLQSGNMNTDLVPVFPEWYNQDRANWASQIMNCNSFDSLIERITINEQTNPYFGFGEKTFSFTTLFNTDKRSYSEPSPYWAHSITTEGDNITKETDFGNVQITPFSNKEIMKMFTDPSLVQRPEGYYVTNAQDSIDLYGLINNLKNGDISSLFNTPKALSVHDCALRYKLIELTLNQLFPDDISDDRTQQLNRTIELLNYAVYYSEKWEEIFLNEDQECNQAVMGTFLQDGNQYDKFYSLIINARAIAFRNTDEEKMWDDFRREVIIVIEDASDKYENLLDTKFQNERPVRIHIEQPKMWRKILKKSLLFFFPQRLKVATNK